MSVADREWIEANTTDSDGNTLKKYNDEDGYTDAYYELITDADLQCNEAMGEQYDFAQKHGFDDEDLYDGGDDGGDDADEPIGQQSEDLGCPDIGHGVQPETPDIS